MRFKIFSDPVHGFISVPKGLMLDLIQSPEVQRLRRIRQLGVGHLVFPGAEHTRFGHALGAMALMQEALKNLSQKGTPISDAEHEAALAAALLHDIGHGPFSHTLEYTLIRGFAHEQMSRRLIERLNGRFDGSLELALRIFDNEYGRPFFHQLISSQLDMDRLDYLRRDSFFTGVAEGGIGVDRIIKTLRVHPVEGGNDARIVVEAKGSYAVENYLLSRRIMYWQVYLHKTVIAGDHLLMAALERAMQLLKHNRKDTASTAPALRYFLMEQPAGEDLGDTTLIEEFLNLDDSDVLYSLKQWTRAHDPLLSDLSFRFLNRRFFRLAFLEQTPSPKMLATWRSQVASWMESRKLLDPETEKPETGFYLHSGRSSHLAYEPEDNAITVLDRWGKLNELSHAADTGSIHAISGRVAKPYICYPKEVALEGIEPSTM